MKHDDVLHHFRVRLFALADELGNVRAACRMLGVHPSTYDRWRKPMLRWGLDALRPRERRAPQMPNRTPLWEEAQILAVALAHPGWGPDRLAAELRRPRWGGHRRSPHGVWGVLRRAGLNTRAKRRGLIAGYQAPPEPQRRRPEPVRHSEATYPGDRVQVDCFYVGNLAGSRGRTWQYTAIDVASSYTWAALHNTPRNPSARHTAALVQHVARDLARRGWRLDRVSTDNSAEFTSATFTDALQAAGIRHTRIAAGRPQSNGCVERVHQTILEECYRPTFARALVPPLHRPAHRSGPLFALLQRRPRPHRAPDPRPHPGPGLGSCQNVAAEAREMSPTRRYISGRGQPSGRRWSCRGCRPPSRTTGS